MPRRGLGKTPIRFPGNAVSVVDMPPFSPQSHLVEWYRPDFTVAGVDEMVASLEMATANSISGDVRLIVSMSVPSDEVLYAVFEASSTEAIVDVCHSAGLPPQRVTTHVDARIHVTRVT